MMLASSSDSSVGASRATDSADGATGGPRPCTAAGWQAGLSAPGARKNIGAVVLAAVLLGLIMLFLGRQKAAWRAAQMRSGGTTQPSPYLEFLGASSFEQHEMVLQTEMGGISGLSYHAGSDEWYAISDRNGKFWRLAVEQDGWRVSAVGVASYWRDCHFANALSPSLLKHLLKMGGVGWGEQNDSRADG